MNKNKTTSGPIVDIFCEFAEFDGDVDYRMKERKAFIDNLEYTPNYDYPRLDDKFESEDFQDRKRSIYKVLVDLHDELRSGAENTEEIKLKIDLCSAQINKIELVKYAKKLGDASAAGNSIDLRTHFSELNKTLYGELNKDYYLGIMASEKKRLSYFDPTSDLAVIIKSELQSFLEHIDAEGKVEVELLDENEICKLHDYVVDRYSKVLSVIPEGNDAEYDVKQCVDIMNLALKAGGLDEMGWKVKENDCKMIPMTCPDEKVIYLPKNTTRTASALRRLIIHEQEVHARRAQNGHDSGLDILRTGTADFNAAEEGLGVLLECAVDGNFDSQSFKRARNRYITAGLALGGDRKRDARETYEILWRLIAIQDSDNGDITSSGVDQAKKWAYDHVENAYRGTQFWMKGVIYTKLKIYYEGLIKNTDYFKQNINFLGTAFDEALIGKYDHTDSDERALIVSALMKKKATHK